MTVPEDQTPRILLVEADPHQQELLSDAIAAHYGLAEPQRMPTVISTGQDCLAQPLDEFDVILMEVDLPDMSGLDLIQEVHAGYDIPVILLTGQHDATVIREGFRLGAGDVLVKVGDYVFGTPALIDKTLHQFEIEHENRRLQDELQTMLSELRVKNVQLEESLTKLREMADTDHLTGLANRRKLAEAADVAYGEAARYDYDLSVCMIDLDHYKQLNDTLGHQMGDRALVVAADIIRRSLRASDVAARYGGDEFVLLLPHTSIERAVSVCERIRHRIDQASRQMPGLGCSLTISAGAASLRGDGPDCADGLLSMADKALYAAKEAGKDRTITFASLPCNHAPG